MANVTIDPWKATAIGVIAVVAAIGVTTMVVGQKSENPPKVESTQKAIPKHVAVEAHRTTQAEIAKCNDYATAQAGDKTNELLKDAAIGAVAGAGTGSAGGAIAGGGSGAGK